MWKDLVFALELGIRVIGMFLICLFIGYQVDAYFHSYPYGMLMGLMIAFVSIMKLLLGAGKHG